VNAFAHTNTAMKAVRNTCNEQRITRSVVMLRCPQQQRHPQRRMLQRHARPARLAVRSSAISSVSSVQRPTQCTRQQSLVCRSWRSAYNGLTAGGVASVLHCRCQHGCSCWYRHSLPYESHMLNAGCFATGLNEAADEETSKPELDMSLKVCSSRTLHMQPTAARVCAADAGEHLGHC
jgi:hypothetical protein